MAYKKRTLTIIVLLLGLLWSTACTPAVPTSTPTIDLNPFRTEVAATVLAQVTQSLALTPSVTPTLAPTPTIRPTSTTEPTASPTATLISETIEAGTEDLAEYVSQSIADDTVFAPGEAFNMSWRLKNTGVTTWTPAYLLRYYSGEAFGAQKEIAIGQEVPPGGEIEISIPMKAPANPGTYRSDWVMSTESRANFKEPVFLKIKVEVPPTPTRTPTLTSTPTPTPSQ